MSHPVIDEPTGRSTAVAAGRSPLRLVGRAGWGVVDQGFVSLANFGLGVLVARASSATDFGSFGIAFAAYLVALNIARGFATQPLTIRFGTRSPEEFRRGSADSTGLALVLGIAGMAICLVLAAGFGGSLGASFIGLAFALPGLLLQDAWRFVLFTSQRGRQAMVNDLIATVCLGVLAVAVIALGYGSALTIMLCWGGGATAAAIVGVFQTGVRPSVRPALAWMRAHWDITPSFLGSELVQMAGAQLVTFAVGGLVGLAAVGSLRGAQLLMGPAYVLSSGVHLAMVPEAARVVGTRHRLQWLAITASAALSVAGVAWGALALLLPNSIGTEVLGDTWPGARSILVPIAIASILPLATTGARIGLRALEEAGPTLRVSTLQSGATLVGGVIGAVADGTEGAAWGMALGVAVAFIVWWVQFERAVHRRSERDLAAAESAAGARSGQREAAAPAIGRVHES